MNTVVEHETPTQPIICNDCNNRISGVDITCRAFENVPNEIISGKNDHSKPFPGQKNDIVFECVENPRFYKPKLQTKEDLKAGFDEKSTLQNKSKEQAFIDIIWHSLKMIENNLYNKKASISDKAKSDLSRWITYKKEELSRKDINSELLFEIKKAVEHAENLKEDVNPQRTKYSVNVVLLQDIYTESNGKIFNCNSNTEFIYAVEVADFSMLIKENPTITKIYKLIFFLSKVMGEKWYKKTANSIGKEPTECSKAYVPGHDKWRKRVENAINTNIKQ
jgi:hypothetical protein